MCINGLSVVKNEGDIIMVLMVFIKRKKINMLVDNQQGTRRSMALVPLFL